MIKDEDSKIATLKTGKIAKNSGKTAVLGGATPVNAGRPRCVEPVGR
jgi:hypothetical protein